MLTCVIMTVTGFFSGSVMYSYLIPKLLYKADVRQKSDDGNPGSANAMGVVGVPIGVLCMFLDLMKAFIPVFIASALLGVTGVCIIFVMIAPVLGHAFSPFLGFHGGKAVASSFGSLLGVILISKAVFVLVIIMVIFRFIITIKPDSSSVITSYIFSFFIILLLEPLLEVKIAVFLIGMVVCFKNYINPNRSKLSLKVGPLVFNHEEKFKFTRG